MKIQFNKRKIANNCTYVAYVLIVAMLVLSVLAVADMVFRWNIFSWHVERILMLLMWAAGLSIVGAFLISIMVNMSIMADSLERLANNSSTQKPEQHESDEH